MPKHVLAAVALAAILPLAMPLPAQADEPDTATADFLDNDGQTIGTVTVRDGPNGVVIRVELQPGAIEPGWHAIHIHAVGDCSDHHAFEHSEGHLNPDDAKHGFLHPEGPDAGDLPNLFAAADGSANAEFFNYRVRLHEGDAALLDDDGTAFVIHENPDDHESQPIGGAGDRIACAALTGTN